MNALHDQPQHIAANEACARGVEFAKSSFSWLALEGQRLITGDITSISGPGTGHVLSRQEDTETLTGYDIDVIHTNHLDAPDFEQIGFTPEEQEAGLWVILDKTYYPRPGLGWDSAQPKNNSHIFASYNGSSWKVARLIPDAPRDDWCAQWGPSQIRDTEKQALGKVGLHTAFLRDAAFNLKDHPQAYSCFETTLKAMASANERVGEIGAVRDSWGQYLPSNQAATFPHVVAQLENIARPLYRALTGKEQSDSTGIVAVRSLVADVTPLTPDNQHLFPITDSLLCPPFEM